MKERTRKAFNPVFIPFHSHFDRKIIHTWAFLIAFEKRARIFLGNLSYCIIIFSFYSFVESDSNAWISGFFLLFSFCVCLEWWETGSIERNWIFDILFLFQHCFHSPSPSFPPYPSTTKTWHSQQITQIWEILKRKLIMFVIEVKIMLNKQ